MANSGPGSGPQPKRCTSSACGCCSASCSVVNLRLLGVMKQVSFQALHRLLPWAMLGLTINVVTGMVFVIAIPGQYARVAVLLEDRAPDGGRIQPALSHDRRRALERRPGRHAACSRQDTGGDRHRCLAGRDVFRTDAALPRSGVLTLRAPVFSTWLRDSSDVSAEGAAGATSACSEDRDSRVLTVGAGSSRPAGLPEGSPCNRQDEWIPGRGGSGV
jgi:hypothetical protein